MERNAKTSRGKPSHLRDWIDPTRIYNPTLPAGKMAFFWGLAVYPLAVIFLFLTVNIILMETFYTGADLPDYLGIVIYFYMMAWVIAAVCICMRRLNDLGKSQRWVWLVVPPIVNLIFFLYLLLKSSPAESHWAA